MHVGQPGGKLSMFGQLGGIGGEGCGSVGGIVGIVGSGDSGGVGGIVSNGRPSQVSMRRIRHVVGGTCERGGASNCGGGRIRPTIWRRHHIRKIVQWFEAVTGRPATKRPRHGSRCRRGRHRSWCRRHGELGSPCRHRRGRDGSWCRRGRHRSWCRRHGGRGSRRRGRHGRPCRRGSRRCTRLPISQELLDRSVSRGL